MMEFVVFTLFPEMFHGVLQESIIRRALDSGAVSIRVVNFREYAADKHRTVDDYPFGGGAGMLLKPGPLFAAVEDAMGLVDVTRSSEQVDVSLAATGNAPLQGTTRILMSPQGRPFTQAVARELSGLQRIALICGHYEGFDERIRQHLVDDEISLGDFVLTGGEIPAMAVMDAVIRLLPGVLGNHDSAAGDSFAAGLLEHPQYTRPAQFRGWRVPDTLLSGHHDRVDKWRRRHALYRTWARRPELLRYVHLAEPEREMIRRWQAGDMSDVDVPEPGRPTC